MLTSRLPTQPNKINSNSSKHAGFRFDPKVPLVTVTLVSIMLFALLNRFTMVSAERIEPTPLDESTFVPPYDAYVITQDIHGFSYGHMAVDLSAGKGTNIKSPIHGKVTANYIDNLGNTTLVIENTLYKVILLHGKYSVSIGDVLSVGQPVGFESNLGNTTDMQGRSCAGRACGYHTHLNVYSKLKGMNLNPLDLMDD